MNVAQRLMEIFNRHGLCTDVNGDPVQAIWTPTGGDATPINALRRRPFEVLLETMESNKPSLDCAMADVPNVARGDAVAVGDVNYLVVGVEPDGKGFVNLALQEQ